jgi:hypothetical protein
MFNARPVVKLRARVRVTSAGFVEFAVKNSFVDERCRASGCNGTRARRGARGTSIAPCTLARLRLRVRVMEQQMLMAAEADSAEMLRCIDYCERCHRVCLRTAMTYCLEQGGEHVEPPYFRLMLACAQICSTTADALLSEFESYEQLCALCANICRTCAASCERIGDMEECVESCRRCAEGCERLSGAQRR